MGDYDYDYDFCYAKFHQCANLIFLFLQVHGFFNGILSEETERAAHRNWRHLHDSIGYFGSFLQCQRAYSCKEWISHEWANAAEKVQNMRSSERYEIPRASS
ncbi:hypothetical protein TNCV_1384961 [Trichonephila clavipes]|nr:hypothetical protein TNCV_1384961 [Trichonephila clavipes]